MTNLRPFILSAVFALSCSFISKGGADVGFTPQQARESSKKNNDFKNKYQVEQEKKEKELFAKDVRVGVENALFAVKEASKRGQQEVTTERLYPSTDPQKCLNEVAKQIEKLGYKVEMVKPKPGDLDYPRDELLYLKIQW